MVSSYHQQKRPTNVYRTQYSIRNLFRTRMMKGSKNKRTMKCVALVVKCVAIAMMILLPCISLYRYNNFFRRDTFRLQDFVEYEHARVKASKQPRQNRDFEPLSCPSFLNQPFLMPDPNNGTQILKKTKITPKFNISLHNKSFDPVRWCIYEYGQYYEDKLTKLVKKTLRNNPNSIFLDVGANIGWFSLLALAEGHEVVAFEPHPINYLRFCQSVAANGWEDRKLSLFPYGVGNVHGDVLTLNTRKLVKPGEFSFRSMKHDTVTNYSLNVTIVTLDAIAEKEQWFKNNDVSIAFMKMDVEGFEVNVLKGATRLLDSKKVKLIELEYKAVKNPKPQEKELVDILIAHGYCLKMYGGWKGPDEKNNEKVPKTDRNLTNNLAALATNNQQMNLIFGCCDCEVK